MLKETTLNIGTKVWFVHNNTISHGVVESVHYHKHISKVDFETESEEISYGVVCYDGKFSVRLPLNSLSLTKQNLIDRL